MVSILLLERPRSRARFDLVQVPTELRVRLRGPPSAAEPPATRENHGQGVFTLLFYTALSAQMWPFRAETPIFQCRQSCLSAVL